MLYRFLLSLIKKIKLSDFVRPRKKIPRRSKKDGDQVTEEMDQFWKPRGSWPPKRMQICGREGKMGFTLRVFPIKVECSVDHFWKV